MKKRNRLKANFIITLFVGIAFAYFMWLSWSKLTDWIGNGWVVWAITGSIVFLAILLGYFSFDKLARQFI